LNPTKFFSQKLARLKILSLSLLRISANFLKMKEITTEFSTIQHQTDRRTPAGSYSTLKWSPAKLEWYRLKLERYRLKPERYGLKPEWYGLKPERYGLKLGRYGLKLERYRLKPERYRLNWVGESITPHCFELTV
jgi:hypothetical protein